MSIINLAELDTQPVDNNTVSSDPNAKRSEQTALRRDAF